YLVSNTARWTEVAYYMIGAGIIGGVAAAVAGWIDWFAIPQGTRAKRIGLIHGVGNVAVLGLFILSWLLRRGEATAPPTEAIVAARAGAGLALVTGWLGGELVNRLGVGVDDGAHLDAPSSLSALPAGSNIGTTRSASARYMGRERRRYPQPAYAGAERRAHGTRA
ncbi:MAG TPA: DUF2231 domain-containing protein, partial [Gemmatimonadales bacterium]